MLSVCVILAVVPQALGVETLIAAPDSDALRERGQAIYKQQCVVCHGATGQGVEDFYPEALVGDSTIGQLAEIISETMPEESPESCVAADADAVAAYIHQAFYSEAARLRNRPPRIALARLTATQLRQSLADLFGHFDGVPAIIDQHGVQGDYFKGARWKKENRKIERLDPTLDFDFGDDGPGEDIDPKDFYINWEGGLKIDQTGRYEIIVRSTCSFVMDFGAHGRQLIDNHVQSGDKTEFRRTLFLTAGRVYPFKIDFFQRKRKTKQPPARISMSWIPPGGTEQIVPTRQLVSGWVPPTFSLQTRLPADDRSYGFERGVAIDRQWDNSTTAAAVEFADIARAELWPRYQRKHRSDDNENRQQLKDFLLEVVSVAFGQDLDDELRKRYIDSQVDREPDDNLAIKRVLLLSLKSPRFLYPLIDSGQDLSRRAANRLTLTLMDAIPTDPWLLQTIEKGNLENEKQIRQAAWRMVDDYRTYAKIRDLMLQWLNVASSGEMVKNSEHYPGFDPALVADLRQSLEAMLEEITWSESSDFRQLITADWVPTNSRLAAFYGDKWQPAEQTDLSTFVHSVGDPDRRIGVLTHPLLMSQMAHHDATSPIHRGVFLTRYVLGRTLRPPNEAFTLLSQSLHPDLTTRERIQLQTGSEGCQVCHSKINPLGFALENYDPVGRFREQDNLRPVDAAGSYTTLGGQEVAFAGPKSLGQFLVGSDDVHRAFVNRAFQYLVKQPPGAFGPDTLIRLTKRFQSNKFKMRDLFVDIAVTAATYPLDSDE